MAAIAHEGYNVVNSQFDFRFALPTSQTAKLILGLEVFPILGSKNTFRTRQASAPTRSLYVVNVPICLPIAPPLIFHFWLIR
jgi:hypothetical protein